MSYVYMKTGNNEWTVGFYEPVIDNDTTFVIESEHDSAEAAARRVNYLNGGAPDISLSLRQAFSNSQHLRKSLGSQP